MKPKTYLFLTRKILQCTVSGRSGEERLYAKSSDLAIIPDGMTSQLQPLDVAVNKPFKDYVKQEYEDWLMSDNLPLTATGKIRKAPASVVATWVSSAWKKIDHETIRRSYKAMLYNQYH